MTEGSQILGGYLVGVGVIIIGVGVLFEVFGRAGDDQGLRRVTKWVVAVGLLFILGPIVTSCVAAEYRCASQGQHLVAGHCVERVEP